MTESPAVTGQALLSPQRIIDAGLAASRSDGCVVVVRSQSQANVRWANNTVTTSGVSTSLEFYVVAVTGSAAGTVSGSAADAESADGVAAVVRAAEAAARAAADAGPARDALPLVGGDAEDGFESGAEPTDFQVYAGLLPGLAAAFDDARSHDRILYGFARHEMTTVHLGSSTGLRRRWVQPTGTMELNAKSADLARSSWAGLSTADFTDVDVLAMSGALTDRLDWARRRVDLPPGRYDTVLPPTAVADFMVYLAWSAGARAAHEGRSAFAAPGGTRIGERLTDRRMTLFADPSQAGIECAPFVETPYSSDEVSVFDNGAEAGRIELVRDGVISQLIQTRASADEYGEPFTPGVDNLVLAGGDETRTTADLVAGVDRGLLVTSQWYLREVDPMTLLLTGLTRDGVFLIERGEITAAVNNFRFNVSPLDVLRRAAEVGRTERCLSREWSDWFTRSAMPSIRMEGFHMSSVSKAQ
ncbi:MAG TPA: metallopeptidase TldD-related protein [Nakamurella sp.]|nr:metallopeptidase TldD-related protein [Nakamurella sp.]